MNNKKESLIQQFFLHSFKIHKNELNFQDKGYKDNKEHMCFYKPYLFDKSFDVAVED
jgi:hypothetical protein